MIVGNGLIANLFRNDDRENVVFFASGVSNSLETRRDEFLREETLVLKTLEENPEKIFIYFSTCSIYDSSKNDSAYVIHKLKIERLVEDYAKNYLILRVSNVVGKGGNPNLLINYLVSAVKKEDIITVHTLATRNLIDASDVKEITTNLLAEGNYKKIVNVAYLYNFSTSEIIELIEKHCNKNAITTYVESGQSYIISVPEVKEFFFKKAKENKKEYLIDILKKYY